MKKLNRSIFGVLFLLAFFICKQRDGFALKPNGTITITNVNCGSDLVHFNIHARSWAGCNATQERIPIGKGETKSVSVPSEVANEVGGKKAPYGPDTLPCTYFVEADGIWAFKKFDPNSTVTCQLDKLGIFCACD